MIRRAHRYLAGLSALLPAALLLPANPAVAQTARPADPASTWTLQGENDSVSTLPEGSDKYYTSGLRLGWTSGTDAVPSAAAALARRVWGDGVTRISFDITQQIFTPANIYRVFPNPRDRPVAAYLAGTFSVLQDIGNTRSTLAVSLGMIGPAALGRTVQNGFHELIHERINEAWGSQLPNEPAVELVAERIWRLGLVRFGPIAADALPSLTAGIGTVRDYVQSGLVLRIGHAIDSDFGVSRIRPGITGGDAFAASACLPWYVFAGVDGQVVARDAFLDGDIFTRSARVPHDWLLGEMEVGAAVIWHGVRFSYTQTWQTASFKGQKHGLFNFGSLTASVRF